MNVGKKIGLWPRRGTKAEVVNYLHAWKLVSLEPRMRLVFRMLSNVQVPTINPIQYGLFLKHYRKWGALWPPLVTLPFLKVEGQNLVGWGILMCFLQKWH